MSTERELQEERLVRIADAARRVAAGPPTQHYPILPRGIDWEDVENYLVYHLDYGIVTYDTWFSKFPGQGLAFSDSGDHRQRSARLVREVS